VFAGSAGNQPGKADAAMPKKPPVIDPHHQETQALLRLIGPIVLGLGVVLTAIGLISFFSSLGTFEPPRYFWAAFVGLPLIAVGLGITKLGYLGAFFRYFSGEVTPVAEDTFNRIAEGTQEGVETLAQALGRGFTAGSRATTPPEQDLLSCDHCDAPNPAGAQFCSQCGTALKAKICPNCGATLKPIARFCSQCGKPTE
jgi:ribosomal protein L40E